MACVFARLRPVPRPLLLLPGRAEPPPPSALALPLECRVPPGEARKDSIMRLAVRERWREKPLLGLACSALDGASVGGDAEEEEEEKGRREEEGPLGEGG